MRRSSRYAPVSGRGGRSSALRVHPRTPVTQAFPPWWKKMGSAPGGVPREAGAGFPAFES
jgi:hypothetical protein